MRGDKRIFCGPQSWLLITRCSIYHPFTGGGQRNPVLLYLPRGVHLQSARPGADQDIISLLSSTCAATVVQVNYRHGPEYPFPTPVHDVLAGYDWVVDHLSPKQVSRFGRESRQRANFGVCGELLGGGLATMLALTQCRLDESKTAAAAVGNPIVDWLFPREGSQRDDEVEGDDPAGGGHRTTGRKRAKSKLAAVESWFQSQDHHELKTSDLISARDASFRKTETYMDPFASPIHFFRTPATEAPSDDLASEPFLQQFVLEDSGESALGRGRPTRRARKSYRNYPPTGSSLGLPHFRLSVGAENVLYDQGAEIVRLMQRSFLKQRGKEDIPLDIDEGDDEQTPSGCDTLGAEDKITLALASGTGLWCSANGDGWRTDVMRAGQWLREVLLR